MDGYQLYWGDFHTHFLDLENGDAILRDARENIDFCGVLLYPFEWDRHNGFRVESVQQRPRFLQQWERIQELNRTHYDPGNFTTFLSYEWHGNRTRYGDHNVIYFDEDRPLDDSWELADLYANLRQCRAWALPHHTGYAPGNRSKDWHVFDEGLSPVMEVFSTHGSSEGFDAPYPMEHNGSMGPRATGGTFQDALARGYRIGAIGSNDGGGLQGRWGLGRAAVWASECTREGIWDAVEARRTYAVTGDRIELECSIEGAPMGAVVEAGGEVDVEVAATGSQAIDRVELLHNGYVVDTYCHSGRWERAAGEGRDFKLFIEAGWGPAAHYGFGTGEDHHWDGRLELEGGRLVGIERRFSKLGQKVVEQDERHCAWHLVSGFRKENFTRDMKQGIVVEIKGSSETKLRLDMEGMQVETRIGDLLTAGRVIALLEESKERIKERFGLDETVVHNPDAYYHNARKIKLHRAIPQSGYGISHRFGRVKLAEGRNYFYVRLSQLNGQMAWSSPIWVEVR